MCMSTIFPLITFYCSRILYRILPCIQLPFSLLSSHKVHDVKIYIISDAYFDNLVKVLSVSFHYDSYYLSLCANMYTGIDRVYKNSVLL